MFVGKNSYWRRAVAVAQFGRAVASKASSYWQIFDRYHIDRKVG